MCTPSKTLKACLRRVRKRLNARIEAILYIQRRFRHHRRAVKLKKVINERVKEKRKQRFTRPAQVDTKTV